MTLPEGKIPYTRDCGQHRHVYQVSVQCPGCGQWMLAWSTANRPDAETCARDLVGKHKWDHARVRIRRVWIY